jgi:hypothetical protein
VQVCVRRSQTGALPPHWAFDVHATHRAAVVSHTGRLVPAHFVAFVAEHWPQAPFIWQAGLLDGHCASFVHGTHTFAEQMGVLPPHWAFDVHATHMPVVVLHAAVAPVHIVRLVAEHWPQVPEGWQAGVAPPH